MSAPAIDWGKMGGLVPVVTRDFATGDVLMVAYVNEEALRATLETGFMHYWSRSRGRLWKKGEESGHVQEVVGLAVDCDGDTLLATVRQTGPACHTGEPTCFFIPLHGDVAPVLQRLAVTIEARRGEDGGKSYTAKLLANENLRLKKVVEEAGEVLMAAKDHDAGQLTYEAADLLYHTLVALAAEGVPARAVLEELGRRMNGPKKS